MWRVACEVLPSAAAGYHHLPSGCPLHVGDLVNLVFFTGVNLVVINYYVNDCYHSEYTAIVTLIIVVTNIIYTNKNTI